MRKNMYPNYTEHANSNYFTVIVKQYKSRTLVMKVLGALSWFLYVVIIQKSFPFDGASKNILVYASENIWVLYATKYYNISDTY